MEGARAWATFAFFSPPEDSTGFLAVLVVIICGLYYWTPHRSEGVCARARRAHNAQPRARRPTHATTPPAKPSQPTRTRAPSAWTTQFDRLAGLSLDLVYIEATFAKLDRNLSSNLFDCSHTLNSSHVTQPEADFSALGRV